MLVKLLIMYFLFDIGGTKTRIACSEDLQTLTQTAVIDTSQQFEEGIVSLQEAIKKMSGNHPISAIAGGIAGPLNKDKTSVVSAPNLPHWVDKPLSQSLSKSFQASVFLENDAALAGLGEAVFGAGKGYDIVAYMTISTGVGGVRVVKGDIEQNTFGFEPGHQIIDINGALCYGCQKKGHLEAYIGGASLTKQLGVHPEEITERSVWERIEYDLAIGLNNVSVFWSPGVIVLGGSLMKKIQIKRVKENLQSLIAIYAEIPEIKNVELDDLSGIYGAMALLKKLSS